MSEADPKFNDQRPLFFERAFEPFVQAGRGRRQG
jgi:hypothetical protein